MIEVVAGVWQLDLGRANAFLVHDPHDGDRGLILVDTGPAGCTDDIESAARRLGRSITDIHTILLTHGHADHVGSLAEVKARSGAVAVMHTIDGAVVSGAARGSRRGLGALFGGRSADKPTSTGIEVLFQSGESVPFRDFRALHTPGHTAGHASYLLEREGGVLFAGDALRHERGEVGIPLKGTDDPAVAELSAHLLGGLSFAALCFGHGDAITAGARQRLDAYLATTSVG